MPAPQKEAVAKGEKEQRSKYFREWKGVYTKSKRNSIPQDNWYDLVNVIPLGAGNLHTIDGLSASLVDYTTNSIYWIEYANINSTDYLIAFASNGKVYAYNISANTNTLIFSAMSGSGTRMDQWKSQYILFYDTTGYYSWDGTTFTAFTPTSSTA